MTEINEQMPFQSSRNGPSEAEVLISRKESFQSNQMSHLREQTLCGDDSQDIEDKISDDINTNEELIGDEIGDEFLVDLQQKKQQEVVVLDSVDDYNDCNMQNHIGDELTDQDGLALKRFESNENT